MAMQKRTVLGDGTTAESMEERGGGDTDALWSRIQHFSESCCILPWFLKDRAVMSQRNPCVGLN